MQEIPDCPKALLSVFCKDDLDSLVRSLVNNGFKLLSTRGTQKYIEELGYEVEAVEDLISYPSILGGKVKTLHPKVFGGILGRREKKDEVLEMQQYEIPKIDVIVVDLYPFEEAVSKRKSHEDIIEKIDIGGISLIRAAAKNYKHTWAIPSRDLYDKACSILEKGLPTEEDRKYFSAKAFEISSNYDRAIHCYLAESEQLQLTYSPKKQLRYGENPHQKGAFYGNIDSVFEQLHGKELSYNNLLDADAAVKLISEFNESTIAVLKHNNVCGLASRDAVLQAWRDALAGDPISAFGGIIIANREIDEETADEINELFFEVIIAPSYSEAALTIFRKKKNRVVLILKDFTFPTTQYQTLLNGMLEQEINDVTDQKEKMKVKTEKTPNLNQLEDLEFASKICKHSNSNSIVLVKKKQLLASGIGQTSRVDALKQAIIKAKSFKFDLNRAIMASDGFFPFPDCIEIASEEGVKAVIQPGGSIKDQFLVDYCNKKGLAMVFTGTRHFKH